MRPWARSERADTLDVIVNDPQYALRKKAQLAALGEWTHINGLRQDSRDKVQDGILQSLMYKFDLEKASSSNAPLANSSASTAFLSDSLETPADQVPGGTISFIFERFSATVEKENDGELRDDSSS